MTVHGDISNYEGGMLSMIHLPHDGPVRIVPVKNHHPYKWRTSETKVLLETTDNLGPGEVMYVQLVFDEEAICKRAEPNKHVTGLLGDCYIMVVIEKEGWGDEEDDEWQDETFRIGERLPHEKIARVLSELKWKEGIMFSPFACCFHSVLGDVVQKYREALRHTKVEIGEVWDVIMNCLQTMDHKHIEKTEVAAGMITPAHSDIIIKSKDALEYAINRIFSSIEAWTNAQGIGIYMTWNREEVPKLPESLPEKLPNPDLTCKQIGQKLQPLIARLYDDYFRRLDTLAESVAEKEWRKQEAARREKEAAAKLAAEASMKKQRLVEKRIARLEEEVNRPYTKSGAPRLSKKKDTGRARTKEEQAIHDHHVSTKACRAEIFEAKQQLEQLAAETKRLQKVHTEMRDEEKRQGAAAALKAQVLPVKATVASFVPDA